MNRVEFFEKTVTRLVISEFEQYACLKLGRDLTHVEDQQETVNYINVEDIKKLIKAGFKVIMPSPELVNSTSDYTNLLKDNNIEQTQLKVWVPMKLKKEFQLHCLESDTNMTSAITELLQEYLKKKKAIA